MKKIVLGVILFTGTMQATSAEYSTWQHTGTICLLTTSGGANLPASASEEGFPLLVRLHKDFFDFSQANANGEDIRFSTNTGTPLPYQIERWDPAKGSADIWVRLPAIKGNARQEIRMHWGKADAASESSGPAVFNESNGYICVWHMNEPVKDEVGTLEPKDTGTTSSPGIIGESRHFDVGKGINCGEKIATFPSGSSSHSSEAWFRADVSNATILAWGNEHAQGKVVMTYSSPPHIRMDCYFSGGNVAGGSTIPLSQWAHVVHTYQKGDSQIYVNGVLDGVTTTQGAPLAIKSPARMYIGGWYNNYRFIGDIDEVRISKVVRSADWIKLEYENQKPMQTLAGPLVQPGDAFSVTPAKVDVLEAKTVTLTATAKGAQKIYWILKEDGRETIAAVDRLAFTFDAGRVNGDKASTLILKAVYPDGVRTKEIPIRIQEDVPEPVFAVKAPKQWDGRETIELAPQISNLDRMQAKGAGNLNYTWNISGLAVIKEIAPGKLLLKRAQNSGNMIVAVAVDNGGAPASQSIQVLVKEPRKDAWVQRTPDKDEKPVDNQFYARGDKNEGTLYYNGTLDGAADSVFLKVYADDKVFKAETRKLSADKTYAMSVKLKPGLIKYKAEFGSQTGSAETVLQTANNLVCGDAYMIDGQSNALATDWGKGDYLDTSEWIRSFGANGGDVGKGWGNAVRRQGGCWQIGCWAMDLAKLLVESQKVPICIINGAAGGTLIEAHQRNAQDPTDKMTIYGRLLNRIQQARLTHGIRGAFWHQGENNQGTQGATGKFGWETYEKYFVDMAAAWKEDYPNIQHYYVFQIWPNSCSMGGTVNSDKLREVQRTLSRLYSNMTVMSTLGIKPEGTCHFPPAGYAEMARLMWQIVEQKGYGKAFDKPVTSPDLKKACYAGGKADEILLEFDQPMAWDDALISEFYLDGKEGKVASGSASGNVVKLKLAAPDAAKTITYLKDRKWSSMNLLCGTNGIAALTFCEVPLTTATPKP